MKYWWSRGFPFVGGSRQASRIQVLVLTPGVRVQVPPRAPKQKPQPKGCGFLFWCSEINPLGICEILFQCEIWLRHVKCASRVMGFISFHLRSKFHNAVISHPKDISLLYHTPPTRPHTDRRSFCLPFKPPSSLSFN